MTPGRVPFPWGTWWPRGTPSKRSWAGASSAGCTGHPTLNWTGRWFYVLAEGVAGPGGPLEFKLWLAALHRRGSQDILDYATVDGVTFVTLRYAPGKGIAPQIAESIAFHEARRAAQDGEDT